MKPGIQTAAILLRANSQFKTGLVTTRNGCRASAGPVINFDGSERQNEQTPITPRRPSAAQVLRSAFKKDSGNGQAVSRDPKSFKQKTGSCHDRLSLVAFMGKTPIKRGVPLEVLQSNSLASEPGYALGLSTHLCARRHYVDFARLFSDARRAASKLAFILQGASQCLVEGIARPLPRSHSCAGARMQMAQRSLTAQAWPIKRPLVDIAVGMAVIDASAVSVLKLIDGGELEFAFNIARPGKQRRYVRILTESLRRFVNGISDPMPFDKVLSIVVPGASSSIYQSWLARMLNVETFHITTLIRCGVFEKCGPRKNRTDSQLVTRQSVYDFLTERRL
jgi:hypothetical protein